MLNDGVLDAPPLPAQGYDDAAFVARLRERGSLLLDLLEAVPTPLLLLDDTLRIVRVNAAARHLLAAAGAPPPAGLRPGEAIGCVRARSAPGLCTVDPGCAGCGALQALNAARLAGEAHGEWRLTVATEDAEESAAYALRVRRLDGVLPEPLWLASLQDLAEERRREGLQRIFFHDVLNITGGIEGLAQILPELAPAERDESLGLLERLAVQLTDTIGAQRDLLWAEQGDLRPSPQPFDLGQWLRDLAGLYARHPVAEGRTIACPALPRGEIVTTDGGILARVVGNLLKNALEASARGETVTLRATLEAGRCRITVHNPAVIPPEVRKHVFQRSFSTKSHNRGLGAYSARLLTRTCLHGTLTLASAPGTGTLFTVDIPARA